MAELLAKKIASQPLNLDDMPEFITSPENPDNRCDEFQDKELLDQAISEFAAGILHDYWNDTMFNNK